MRSGSALRLQTSSFFGVSCGNASPLLQMKEGVFYQMPCPIKLPVVVSLLLTIPFGRYDGLHPFGVGYIHQGIGIISPVRQEIRSLQAVNQGRSLRTICDRTRCNDAFYRHSMSVDRQMDLAVQPPLVTPIS